MSTAMLQVKVDAIPFVDLAEQHRAIRKELLEAVGRVLDHGKFILGPETTELEALWAKRCGTRFAVGVADGTAALTLSMKALGIGRGDEVITAPNSFVASVASIIHAGARPRLADVGDDFNLDPARVRAAVTDRTRAILAVHLGGRPARMDVLCAIANECGLLVIEDAAQAFGASSGGRSVGGFGAAGCFSLHPLKSAGACGDGGMITTNDEALAHRLRRLGNHGITKRQEDCAEWGMNSRFDTMQAAMVLVKMRYVDAWIARRRANAAIYRRRLEDIVDIPPDRDGDNATYHTFVIETDHRDALVDHLMRHDVGCSVHYRRPIHLLDAARELGYHAGDFPAAERQAERMISLPVHEGLRDEHIHHVCDLVEAFHG